MRCTCNEDDGTVITGIRWYDPDGKLVPRFGTYQFIVGAPHFIRPDGHFSNRNITLVIPTFTDSYDGIYTCGRRKFNHPPLPPTANVNLNSVGELLSQEHYHTLYS